MVDLEVAVTGKLASMSRREARDWIVQSGATYAARTGKETSVLVVGQGGPPLGEDGRLTRDLLEARRMQSEGGSIEIISEEEFLIRIGHEERQEGLHRLYTTEQLSRILDVDKRQIRTWIRHELIRPVRVVRRLCFFDFRQVASAKALGQLTESGVTPAQIRKSLSELGTWAASDSSALSQLEVLEQETDLFVRTNEGKLAETSGQLRLDFEGAQSAAQQPSDLSGDDWFERAILAEEEGDLVSAAKAYGRAAVEDGPEPESSFNLGNVLYTLGHKKDAAKWFERATHLDPDYVEAWNNLGNALGEDERYEEAIHAYRRALILEPLYADAHFNLAETLAHVQREDEARPHWEAYLSQDPHSAWADVVRDRLRET